LKRYIQLDISIQVGITYLNFLHHLISLHFKEVLPIVFFKGFHKLFSFVETVRWFLLICPLQLYSTHSKGQQYQEGILKIS
jgi:hypothetical protein